MPSTAPSVTSQSGCAVPDTKSVRACMISTEVGEGLAVQGEAVRKDGSAAPVHWLHRITLPGHRP